MTKQAPPDVPVAGTPAPDFACPADDGTTVRLSDLRGQKVILYFYPKAMTTGCTVQAQCFRDAASDLAARGAIVLGVSPDAVERLEKFVAQEGLNFRLLSDADHEVAQRYGVWRERSMYGRKYMGIVRSQFLIDEEGVIRAVAYGVQPKESVPEALEALADA